LVGTKVGTGFPLGEPGINKEFWPKGTFERPLAWVYKGEPRDPRQGLGKLCGACGAQRARGGVPLGYLSIFGVNPFQGPKARGMGFKPGRPGLGSQKTGWARLPLTRKADPGLDSIGPGFFPKKPLFGAQKGPGKGAPGPQGTLGLAAWGPKGGQRAGLGLGPTRGKVPLFGIGPLEGFWAKGPSGDFAGLGPQGGLNQTVPFGLFPLGGWGVPGGRFHLGALLGGRARGGRGIWAWEFSFTLVCGGPRGHVVGATSFPGRVKGPFEAGVCFGGPRGFSPPGLAPRGQLWGWALAIGAKWGPPRKRGWNPGPLCGFSTVFG